MPARRAGCRGSAFVIKRRPVALFYLAEAMYGGWVTALAHARESLIRCGFPVHVYRVGAKTEGKERMFGELFPYMNVSLRTAEQLCHASDTFIMATDPKHWGEAEALVAHGAAVVFHDPTELRPESRAVLARANRVVVFRRSNERLLADLGPRISFVPMPYVPGLTRAPAKREYHAIAYSRLDFDKNTDVILRANLVLPQRARVRIFGAENRMYTHHKLDADFAGWRSLYGGTYPRQPGAGEYMAGMALYGVDMSTIAGDGGGTQLTTLEAWAACTVPVVAERWLGLPESELVDEVNCIGVSGGAMLADVLMRRMEPERHRALLAAGQHALAAHGPRPFTEALLP